MPQQEMNLTEIRNNAALIWSIAELLRGDYKQADYGKVILPLVVMRRLDQALEKTKADVVKQAKELEAREISNVEDVLRISSGLQFFNRSALTFPQLLEDPGNIASNLRAYIDGYSRLAHEVFENFEFEKQIDKLDKANLLYMVIGRICDVDLRADHVSNLEMGYLFEDLIRRFAEQSNETAGEHFTPREVVRLMGNLLLDGDEDALTQKGVIRTVFDCACGTGGMLSEVDEHIRELNPNANIHLFGQELNPESYAICLADMLVKGQDASKIVLGNSLSNDGHRDGKFHYCIANPPFGVDWSKVENEIRTEHSELGFSGRFGPGVPPKSDGQLLFTLHLLGKMRDADAGGTRIAIVHNGSPLFSGGAGSGQSEIRRWIIENDLLESIVALPEQLFYNTDIPSYVWLLTNRKSDERAGFVQLIDASSCYERMPKALGEKRRRVSEEQIAQITRMHSLFEAGPNVRIVRNEDLAFRVIKTEAPLRANWRIDASALSAMEHLKQVKKFPEDTQDSLRQCLALLDSESFSSEADCREAIRRSMVAAGVEKPTAAMTRALAACAVQRDPSLAAVLDSGGELVPDREGRDVEKLRLDVDVDAFMAESVEPFIPGSWCPDREGRIGYEIPFAALFHVPPSTRPSDEVKREVVEVEATVRTRIGEILR